MEAICFLFALGIIAWTHEDQLSAILTTLTPNNGDHREESGGTTENPHLLTLFTRRPFAAFSQRISVHSSSVHVLTQGIHCFISSFASREKQQSNNRLSLDCQYVTCYTCAQRAGP